jgi:peptide chain release factor 1
MSLNVSIGGAEACAFLTELSKAYTLYAEHRRLKMEVISSTEGPPSKGFAGHREMSMKFMPGTRYEGEDEIDRGCYGALRYETGLHRVQRVPVNESGGKIQSSLVNISVSQVSCRLNLPYIKSGFASVS